MSAHRVVIGDASRAPPADSLGPRLGPAATFATTEHFNLQTARAVYLVVVTEARPANAPSPRAWH